MRSYAIAALCLAALPAAAQTSDIPVVSGWSRFGTPTIPSGAPAVRDADTGTAGTTFVGNGSAAPECRDVAWTQKGKHNVTVDGVMFEVFDRVQIRSCR